MYAAFITRGKKSSKWCANHLINFKAISRALSIRSHLERYLVKTLGLTGPSQLPSCLGTDGPRVSDPNEATIKIRKCLVSGYFAQAAKIAPDGTHWISALEARPKGARALSYTPTKLWMHPTSILFKQTPQWVIFHEVVETGKGKAYMREVTAIEPEWLGELAPHFYVLKKQL